MGEWTGRDLGLRGGLRCEGGDRRTSPIGHAMRFPCLHAIRGTCASPPRSRPSSIVLHLLLFPQLSSSNHGSGGRRRAARTTAHERDMIGARGEEGAKSPSWRAESQRRKERTMDVHAASMRSVSGGREIDSMLLRRGRQRRRLRWEEAAWCTFLSIVRPAGGRLAIAHEACHCRM
ncbi:hypothetical protein B0H12DRAFT_1108899 [Mycena haematopus]|nr:hypothetical protein B0H12DRAFT_1108899 [Mycena haematopus]